MEKQDRKNLKVLPGAKNKLTLKKSIIILCILLLAFFSGQHFVKIYQQKKVIDDLRSETINKVVNQSIAKDAELQTDDSTSYVDLSNFVKSVTIQPKSNSFAHIQ